MSTFIPPTPAATKSAEQHEEPSEQDSFDHLLFKVLRLTSAQVQDLNDWMNFEAFQMFMRSLCKASADLMHLRMICISSEKTKHATLRPM